MTKSVHANQIAPAEDAAFSLGAPRVSQLIVTVSTPAVDSNWQALPNTVCGCATIINTRAGSVPIKVAKSTGNDDDFIVIPAGDSFTCYVTNANQVKIQRESGTGQIPVSVELLV